MLSTKVHKARQLASHALPLTRRILSLGKGLLHKVTGLAGRLLGAVGRCVRQVTDYLLESKAVRAAAEAHHDRLRCGHGAHGTGLSAVQQTPAQLNR